MDTQAHANMQQSQHRSRTNAQGPCFVRHEMNAADVAWQVDLACAAHEARRDPMRKQLADMLEWHRRCIAEGRRWTGPGNLGDPGASDRLTDANIARERGLYASVHVVERTDRPAAERFALAYGDGPDSAEAGGTGPWPTLAQAVGCFLRGGR